MFSQPSNVESEESKPKEKTESVPYINKYNNQVISNSVNFNTLDTLLEKEKQQNKTEHWNNS